MTTETKTIKGYKVEAYQGWMRRWGFEIKDSTGRMVFSTEAEYHRADEAFNEAEWVIGKAPWNDRPLFS
jgi:hypothetical protein